MKKIIVGVLVGILTLSACGSTVDNGKITEKRYTPAKEWWEDEDITEEQCEWDSDLKTTTTYVNGKAKTSTKTVREWECEDIVVGSRKVRKTAPAQYQLLLRQDDGDTGTVTVSKTVYDSVKKGQYYGEKD